MDSLTAHLQGLEDLLLASATFTASITLDSTEEIRDQRIFWESIVDDNGALQSVLPAASICETAHGAKQYAEGLGPELGFTGEITLQLAANASKSGTHTKARKAFIAWSAQIIDDISCALATGDYQVEFVEIALAQAATRTPPTEAKAEDYFWCSYTFRWGFDG